MNKLNIAKTVISTVAGMGAARVVGKAIAMYVPKSSTFERIVIPVGAFAMGSLVGDAVVKHTEQKFDEIATYIGELNEKYNK